MLLRVRRGAAGYGRQLALVLGALAVVLGAAQPWLRTGRKTRSAFALARSARRLGLAEGAVRRVALNALFVSPLLAGFVVALVAWQRPRWAVGPGLALGALGVVAGAAGFTIPGDQAHGPILTMLAGMICFIGAVACSRVTGGASSGQIERRQR